MKKIIYLFWLICIISFSNYNAQTASTVCVNSTTLSAGSYSNLTSTSQVGWFTLSDTVSNIEVSLINNFNNQLFNINKIEVFSGPCSSLNLIATDSLTNVTDSTLFLSLTNLNQNSVYHIKLTRLQQNFEPSNFSLSLNKFAPFCGFIWSLYSNYNNLLSNNSFTYGVNGTTYGLTLPPVCANYYLQTSFYPSTSGGYDYAYVSTNTPSGTVSYTLNNAPTIGGAITIPLTTYNFSCPVIYTITLNRFEPLEFDGCNILYIKVYPPINGPLTAIPNPVCNNGTVCINAATSSLNCPDDPDGATVVHDLFYGPSGFPTYNSLSSSPLSYNTFSAFASSSSTNSVKCLPVTPNFTVGNNIISNVSYINVPSWPNYYTCYTTFSTNLVVSPGPTVNITASPSIGCTGDNTTLTATGATSYTWQPSNSNGNTLITTFPSGTNTYVVIGSNGECTLPFTYTLTGQQECCKFPKNFGVNFTNVTIQPSNYGGTSIPWSSIVPGGTYNNISILAPPSGNITSNIAVTGSLTINANHLSFNNCNFLFSEAAVVIQNANNTTFNKSYLRACIKNWRGIVSNAALTVRNTVIEDAQYAVFIGFNTIIHPGITIENTLFNKNLVGVAILNRNINGFLYTGNLTTCRSIPNINYNFASSTPWQYQPALNVTSLLTYPSTQLLGSSVLGISNLVRSQQGVLLLNANQAGSSQGILVGNTHPSPVQRQNRRCVYDNLRIGVSVINSTVSVINSYLQQLYPDISQPLTAAFYLEHSRGVFGNSATGAPWLAAIYTNTVDVVVDGVVATNQSTFTVANNIFQNVNRYANNIFNINYGLAISNNLITNNTFTQCNYDLFAFDNRRINLLFENNSSSYTVGGRPRLNYYVYVNEINKPSTAYYQVRFNTPLNGKQNGFTFLNTYGARIDNNNINIVPPTGSSFNANITLQNSDFCEIKNNNLDVIPNALASFNNYGILTDIGANNLYCGNDIKNSGTSLKFQGPSPSRIFNNSLNNNPGNPCQFGIWLDNSASIGPITFTTAFGNATGNNEFGDFSFADTYSQLGSLGSNIDYQGAAGTGNIYYPFINLNDLSGASVCNPISNSFVGPTNCNSGIMAFLQNLSRGVPPFLTGIVNFGGNTANANAMARKSIFELFKKGIYNTTTLVNYNNFMTSNAAANVGKFYNVDSLIYNYAATNNTANIANAQVLNSAISSTNIVEQNQITFNTIYHTYLLNPANITGAQKSTLQTIAQLCPFTDGTSVYQARAILRYFDDSTYYSNPCEVNIPTLPNTGSRLGTGLLSEKTNEVKAYETKLYPNPTKGEVIVTTELTDAEIIVINILGQVVLESKLTNETKLDLSLLKEGTYLYKIIGNGIVLKSDKLIINH